jgi:hypothetical protein
MCDSQLKAGAEHSTPLLRGAIMKAMRCVSTVLVSLTAAVLALGMLAQDTAPRRLILKDGSYQLVTKYEVKGDRVRYYSQEREDWEELPNSLVDWPATEKYEKDRTTPPPEAVQLDKELEREDVPLPEVAPGLRIPEDTGVFLLDTFQGEPQLVEINQTAGDINRNTKINILRGTINPVAGPKQTVELEGAHAPVQSHVAVPTLYLKLDDGPPSVAPSASQAETGKSGTAKDSQPQKPLVASERYLILHAEIKGSRRLVAGVKRELTGKIEHEQKTVKATANELRGGWLKLTPTESLAPGEYAVVEMSDKGSMNLYVWDFGVNPKAGANPNPWKPDVKK